MVEKRMAFLSQFVILWAFLPLCNSLLCLHCDNVYRTADCQKVSKCQTGEACFVEQDSSGHGYNLGCRAEQTCSNTTSPVCTQCCKTDTCNSGNMCGISGLSKTAGPLCYSCNSLLDFEDCTKVAQCQKGELCYTEITKNSVLGVDIHSHSCKASQDCPGTGVFSSTGCNSCCAGPMCNTNCTHAEPPRCPHEWVYFQQACYLVNSSFRGNFDFSQTFCQHLGGHLVHVNNDVEAEFIRRTVKTSTDQADPLTSALTWIGLTDRQQEGTFRWIDDQSMPGYSDWFPNEPNNMNNEDCVQINDYSHFRWNDDACWKIGRPLCEKPAEGTCPSGWIRHGFSCYNFYSDRKHRYWDAQTHCQASGANLVHINTDEEQRFLDRTIMSFNDTLRDADWLIGLQDISPEGDFKWTDDQSRPGFTNWDNGEPNDYYQHEDCVIMSRAFNFRWNDERCWIERFFICEKQIGI